MPLDHHRSGTSTRVPPGHPQPSSNEISEIAALVTRLLSHFWTADEHVAVRQAQIEDWLDDLREFGPAIVREACAEWRRQPDNRHQFQVKFEQSVFGSSGGAGKLWRGLSKTPAWVGRNSWKKSTALSP